MRSFISRSRVLSEGTCVHLSIRFNSSQTIGRANVKLATIDHYLTISVQKSNDVITQINFV